MTLTIDHWVDLQPQQVRQPLLNEMHEAGVTALGQTDETQRTFYTGLFTGYAVGFGLITREALDRARMQPGASAVHIDFRRPRWNDDTDTLWACGVRHGYSLATSENPDADECALCGERIVKSTDDFEGCDDGVFCPFECMAIWHANGPTTCGGE